MNPIDKTNIYYNPDLVESQEQSKKCELNQVQTITKSPLDMEKKEPFHFLQEMQGQLLQTKGPKIIPDKNIYPIETRAIWLAFEEAVSYDDRVEAEALRKELFPESGSLIEPKRTLTENPKTDSERIQNVFSKAANCIPDSIAEKILIHGIEKNNLPLIYLALKCRVEPENLFKDFMGHEQPLLKIALENPNSCDIACIRLLFQFAKNPTIFANGTLLAKPTPRNSFSPLKNAFETGRADVVRELLANGADPKIAWDKQQVREENLFINAADKGHSEIVQLFLQAGFPVNFKNKDGRTALHFAKLRKNDDLVNDLLKAGANPQIMDKSGRDCLQFAEENWKKYDEIARKKLISAFQTNNFEEVSRAGGIEKVISYLFDINESMDEEDNTLLHIAMKHLATYGKGKTPIHELIDLRADLYRANKNNETPRSILQKAIEVKKERIEKMKKGEPLEDGTSFLTEIITDAVKDAQLQQKKTTNPIVPMWIKGIKDEENYLESLQSFDKYLDNKK